MAGTDPVNVLCPYLIHNTTQSQTHHKIGAMTLQLVSWSWPPLLTFQLADRNHPWLLLHYDDFIPALAVSRDFIPFSWLKRIFIHSIALQAYGCSYKELPWVIFVFLVLLTCANVFTVILGCGVIMETFSVHRVGGASDTDPSVGRGRGVLMYTPLSRSAPGSRSVSRMPFYCGSGQT